MNELKFDVAIIGGGPAGSSAAIHLARSGLDVCIFERKKFPREVLCGEFLSQEVSGEIRKLDLFDNFLSLNPQAIKSFSLINNNSKKLNVDFHFETYALKRSIFDNFLLEEARNSGAEIFQPAEVKNIIRNEDGFILTVINENSEDFAVKSKYVIAAYGKQNTLDKNLQRKFIDKKSNLNGVKFHIDKKFLNNFNSEKIQLYTGDGIYCGINSVSKNDVTVCFLYNRVVPDNSPKTRLGELMKSNCKFNELFKNDINSILNESKIYGTGNIYFGKRELMKDGIFMTGDSAGVIAPLAGDGIGMALQSSSILSEILISGIKNNYNPEIICKNYINRWNRVFSKRLIIAGIIQTIILNKRFRNAGVRIVKYIPALLPVFVKLTRGN